jgi:hypothetical protein
MAIRRIDLESVLGRSAQGPAVSAGPVVPAIAITPITIVPPSSSDPSPFTRARPADLEASRVERISRAAYRRAEQRNFAPGRELDDWLAAEREIDGDSMG